MKIGKRNIGNGWYTFIVAEISCNHQQKKKLALESISAAKESGADAVKFQAYTPDTMTLDNAFKIPGTIWKGQNLYKLYQKAYTPWDWFPELSDRAKDEGIEFFATPFDKAAVDMLETLKVPAYKIASFEINHIPLLKYVASKNKPVMISTGVAEKKDIQTALRFLQTDKTILMKCTSAYPAPLEEANLKVIPYYKREYGVPIGLSDHTISTTAPAYAVAVGAEVIEKHFTLERKGPDKAFSLLPNKFKEMCRNIRECEDALGTDTKLTPKAKEHRFLMRSIYAIEDIKKGEIFTEDNIKVLRPAGGLQPIYYETILGIRSGRDLKKGEPL